MATRSKKLIDVEYMKTLPTHVLFIFISRRQLSLNEIDESLLTRDLLDLFVQVIPKRLVELPEKFQTESLYLNAVKCTERPVLRFVPDQFKTYDVCKCAIKATGESLQYVPKEFVDTDFYTIMLKADGYNLMYIPDRDITDQLRELAVSNCGMALGLMHPTFRTQKLCELAFLNNVNVLDYIPPEFVTNAMYEHAVTLNGRILEHIPAYQRTRAICVIAVTQNGHALKFVPSRFRDMLLCKLAFDSNIEALNYMYDPQIRNKLLLRIPYMEPVHRQNIVDQEEREFDALMQQFALLSGV
jgi:hypothetical protein